MCMALSARTCLAQDHHCMLLLWTTRYTGISPLLFPHSQLVDLSSAQLIIAQMASTACICQTSGKKVVVLNSAVLFKFRPEKSGKNLVAKRSN